MERNLVNIPEITADQLATYGNIQKLYKRGKETWKTPIANVAVRENFNYRLDFGDIRAYADYLAAGGDYDPITVDFMIDGTAVIIDGERTYRAHLLLNSEGVAGFDIIHCFRSPAHLTEVQRRCIQLSKNNNKNFTQLELAEAFKDLKVNHHMSAADIAKATGYNTMRVSDHLRLAGVSDEEKELIKEGAVSPTAVVNMIKGGMGEDERIEAVRSAQSSSGDNGGGSSGSKKSKLKIKDVAVLSELEHRPLDPDKDTIHSLMNSAFTQLRMLNRLIGMDSKMSDVTFVLENDLRNAVKLMKLKNIYGSEGLKPLDPADENKFDSLFIEAAKLVVKHQNGSTSLLQRKLKLGYMRASRIIDQLEKSQVIGPFLGSKPREIFIADEESLQLLVADLTVEFADPTGKEDEDDEQPF